MQMTENLDAYPWQTPEKLEQEADLYFPIDPSNKGSEYFNADVREKTEWESNATHAMNFSTTRMLYPLPDLHHQGYDDGLMAGMRQRLGIQTRVVMEPILFHQWHPQLWSGDIEEANRETVQELAKRFRK